MEKFKGTKKAWLCDDTTVHTIEIPIAYVGGEDKETSLANAKLIAAAPDLLEALQNICDSCDGNNPEHAIFYFTAQAAITKALQP